MSYWYNKYPTFGHRDNRYGMIVFEYRGQTQVVAENLPFALLQSKLQQLKKQPQYFGGKLKIKYYND